MRLNIFTLLHLKLFMILLISNWCVLYPAHGIEPQKCTPLFEKHCILNEIVTLLDQTPPELKQESLIALVNIASEILPSRYLRKESWPYNIDTSARKS